jgi:ribosomal protein S27AE
MSDPIITFTKDTEGEDILNINRGKFGKIILKIGDYITYDNDGTTQEGTIIRFSNAGAPGIGRLSGIRIAKSDNSVFEINLDNDTLKKLKNMKYMAKFCMKCGTKVPSESSAKMCSNCGESLMIPVIPPEYTGGSRRNRRRTNRRRTNRRRTNRR